MRPILNDQYVEPTDIVLQSVMTDNYPNYISLLNITQKYGITPQWQYYNDGKAWLCKMLYKKKNIFWFSVWIDCFKTTFYFTEKDVEHIAELPISESIKSDFSLQKNIGKLIPMIIEVKSNEPLTDIDAIIRYKLNKRGLSI